MSTLVQQIAPASAPSYLDDAGVVGEVSDVAAELNVDVSLREPRALVRVTGTLDSTGGVLVTAMLDHVRSHGLPADLDLCGVTAVDVAGLAVVLEAGVGLQATFPSGTPAVRVLALPADAARDDDRQSWGESIPQGERIRQLRQRGDQETATCQHR